MQRVRLLGELGELFGEEHTYYNLRRPADAIKLLCINKPSFKEYLLKSGENGIGFKVIQADVEMEYEELLLPLGQNELVIAPVITGSGGGGGGKILLGIGLVALAIVAAPLGGGFLGLGAGAFTSTTGAALVTGAATSFATTAVLGAASVAIGSIGASLVLGGVSQMLSPQPKIPQNFGSFGSVGGARFGSRNSTGGPVGVTRGLDGQQSYAYTGAANTVGVGATVPLAYGKVLIGSHLLRSKLQVSDESDPLQKFIKEPGIQTILIGGEKISSVYSDVSGAEVASVPLATKTTFKSPLGGASFVNNVGEEFTINDDAASGVATIAKKTGATAKKNFTVVLRVKNGLLDFAGSFNTTKVDAFVSYEIKVFRGQKAEDNKLIAMDSATIQGLLTENQPFCWKHKMSIPTTYDENNIAVQVKIINTSAESYIPTSGSTPKFELVAIGYQLS